jgi:hypothetical protein
VLLRWWDGNGGVGRQGHGWQHHLSFIPRTMNAPVAIHFFSTSFNIDEFQMSMECQIAPYIFYTHLVLTETGHTDMCASLSPPGQPSDAVVR